jgi:hypothetical protein
MEKAITIKVYPETRRKLKILASVTGKSIMQVLSDIVDGSFRTLESYGKLNDRKEKTEF